ncbi:DNA polymerase I [Candidatus Izemoplasma sp. B36]|uniref:DNA polymerase I n=1 Tax=Candidatus Izemoplasma sp. B36 TaxID=3242468 RepID=UPI0035591EC2
MKKLLLIDASNLLFRSYYATAYTGNLMQNKEGVYTNGIFGFAHAMIKLIDNGYTHILVALDPKGKTHRHLEYKEYKGTRKDTPPELIMQFPLMEEYLDALGVYYYQQDLYEADDIIGYMSKHYKEKFDEVTIYSNDHDLMQLLDTNVKQMVSRKGLKDVEIFTPEYLKEKMGVSPKQITDYKGLVGDASDNIPGVPGVGNKTAVKLLTQYNTIDNLYQHIDEVKGKLKEKLELNKEKAIFSKKLATIETDFDNTIDFNKTEYLGYNQEKLIDFYTRLGLYSFIKNMKIEKENKKQDDFIVIKNPAEIRVILGNECFMHLEYFGKNYHDASPLGFALIFSEISYYIPFDIAINSDAFIKFLQSEKIKKYVFDLKALTVILRWNNIIIKGIEYDLLLAAYLTSSSVNQDEFRDVCELYHYHDVDFEDNIYGKGAKYHLPEDKIHIKHAIDKVSAIKNTYEDALEKIKEFNQEDLLYNVEIPLAKVLSDMEYIGININPKSLEEFGLDLKQKIDETEQLIYDLSGEEFNISSPKQLGVILFEKMQLPVYKKTKTGYSTDISVLSKLKPFSPIIDLIIGYRTYTKLYSTYVEGLKSSLTLKDDNKIHTIYQQALTKTGRLSSKEPNLQNIPIKNEEGRALRKVFEASDGFVLLSFDYSQIELRVLAELGDVKNLIKAFKNNKDIHEETAKLIFKKDNISRKERSIAKAVNFSIIYGKTPWGLSEDLNISLAKAKEFINNYFASYEEIKVLIDKNIAFAKENGYVKTHFNRIIHINEIKAKNYQTREFGKRIAMNAPIQGTAADILKIAMVKIKDEFIKHNIKSKMILQIHDEIVLDVVKEEEKLVTEIVSNTMMNAVDFNVNLLANYSSGKNLYEVK